MKRGKLLEILILVAALALPAWMFYNWKMGINRKKNAMNIESVSPNANKVFKGDAVGIRPSTDTVPSSAPAGGGTPIPQAPAATSAAVPAPVQAAPVAAASPEPVPAGVAQHAAVQSPPPEAAAPHPAETAVEESSMVVRVTFAPLTERDPFLSPEEFAAWKAQRQQQERQAAAMMAARQSASAAAAARRVPVSPEKTLVLQGIVGNQAIVNGELVKVGSVIRGATVFSIGTTSVTFRYKGKTFVKTFVQ